MKNIKHILLFTLASIFLYSCVGEDVIPEQSFNFEDGAEAPVVSTVTVVEPEIVLSRLSIGLMVSDTTSLTATFLDSLGVESEADILLESDNEEVIIVEDENTLKAVGVGTANITASFGDVVTTATVNVVENTTAPSEIIVIADGLDTSLEPGQTISLEVKVLNLDGDELDLEDVVWNVNDNTVATIDEQNILTAIAEGTTPFSVSANGLTSGSLSVTVAVVEEDPIYFERVATFMDASGYRTSGTATLRQEVSTGEITLILKDDFQFQFAISVFLYLSSEEFLNRSQPNFRVDPELTSTGAQSYNLTAEGFTGNINTLDHVLVVCDPFNLTFGTSTLGPVTEIR